jgi:hypothetical protein
MGEARRRYQFRDGVSRETIFDGERLTIETRQDVEPVLDSIARDREIMRHGDNKVVGRLPMIVVEDLIKRGIYDDPDAFDRWWNTTEANPWRIWRGWI